MSDKMTPNDFLSALGLQALEKNFKDNAIDAATLGSLTAEELAEMEISEDDASTILWGISNLTPIFA